MKVSFREKTACCYPQRTAQTSPQAVKLMNGRISYLPEIESKFY